MEREFQGYLYNSYIIIKLILLSKLLASSNNLMLPFKYLLQDTTGLIQMVAASLMLWRCTATSQTEWPGRASCPRRVRWRERAGVVAPSGSVPNKEDSRYVCLRMYSYLHDMLACSFNNNRLHKMIIFLDIVGVIKLNCQGKHTVSDSYTL